MPSEYIQVAGKSDIWIGFPEDMNAATGVYSTMRKVGEQLEETQIAVQNFFHDVFGDRNGGQQGPPIERLILGQIARAVFNLTRFDPEVRRRLQRSNAFATDGTVLDSEVGSLLLRDRSFRLVIVPSKSNPVPVEVPALPDEGDDYFAWNFPCVVLGSPVECGQGSKHSILRVQMEAHRAPDGHPKEGILWNHDVADVVSLIAA